MNEAEESINSFGTSKASEQIVVETILNNKYNSAKNQDAVFLLNSEQIQKIIEAATEPLKIEIKDLWIAYEKLAKDALINNQRIKQLETPDEPRGTDRERALSIKWLLDNNPNGIEGYTFADLRSKFHIEKSTLSKAVIVLLKDYPGQYAIKRNKGDKRSRSLIKLPGIS